MNKLIRHKAFETNSSSCHSISISQSSDSAKYLLDTLPINNDGNIVLTGGQFGWEERQYNDAETKTNYMAIYAMQWVKKKPIYKYLNNEYKEVGFTEDKTKEFMDTLKIVILKQTGAKDVIFDIINDWNDKTREPSYIDHQSVEDREYDYVFEDPKLLRDFIFNKSSILKTDNDNH